MGQCKDILLLLFAAVDACNPTNPCNNGGTCVVTDNSFNCTCPPGIGGQNCTEGKCRQAKQRNAGFSLEVDFLLFSNNGIVCSLQIS